MIFDRKNRIFLEYNVAILKLQKENNNTEKQNQKMSSDGSNVNSIEPDEIEEVIYPNTPGESYREDEVDTTSRKRQRLNPSTNTSSTSSSSSSSQSKLAIIKFDKSDDDDGVQIPELNRILDRLRLKNEVYRELRKEIEHWSLTKLQEEYADLRYKQSFSSKRSDDYSKQNATLQCDLNAANQRLKAINESVAKAKEWANGTIEQKNVLLREKDRVLGEKDERMKSLERELTRLAKTIESLKSTKVCLDDANTYKARLIAEREANIKDMEKTIQSQTKLMKLSFKETETLKEENVRLRAEHTRNLPPNNSQQSTQPQQPVQQRQPSQVQQQPFFHQPIQVQQQPFYQPVQVYQQNQQLAPVHQPQLLQTTQVHQHHICQTTHVQQPVQQQSTQYQQYTQVQQHVQYPQQDTKKQS